MMQEQLLYGMEEQSDPMMERLLESIEREGRRMNFKVIK